MATLRFDTDAGRQASQMIGTSCQTLQTELNNLRNRISSMVGGEWQGASAQQFQGEFENWSGQLRNCLSTLEQLQQRLDREIVEWEQTASNLN